ncbi:EF-hand domain-containing protein [Streptomyces atratus]
MDVFIKLDTDGDGAISRQEFIRAVREHYLSDNPDAPGSLFFGHH